MFGDKPQSSIQILVILFVVSTLIFLSSFISLTHHDIHHPTEHHYTNSREHQLQKSRQQLISPPIETIPPIISSNKSNGKNGKSVKQAPKAKNNANNKKKTKSKPSKPAFKQKSTSAKHRNRSHIIAQNLRFPSKCHINPHIHYWDEYVEENISPLQYFHGLSAPRDKQKFVVFQPDPGGWNNIRMALEVVILLAKVTGRILVMPPNAVLYLLSLNKKWGENKSSMEDYFDFTRLRAGNGLETMTMEEFLQTIALPGLLSLPLPDNNTHLLRKELWNYLESACYVQAWSPGKLFMGLNVSMLSGKEYQILTKQLEEEHQQTHPQNEEEIKLLGTFDEIDPNWLGEFSLDHKRTLLPYDATMHAHRAIYFPGHEANRLLTHYYSYLFLVSKQLDHQAKRFMRNRLRYHDDMFCLGSVLIERLLVLQQLSSIRQLDNNSVINNIDSSSSLSSPKVFTAAVAEGNKWPEEWKLKYTTLQELATAHIPEYVAFHIRRGDFQQKHTRLAAEDIVKLTAELVPDRHQRIAYIATDERNRSFFQPFFDTYKAVYFLDDISAGSGIEDVNQNYVGMIEQVVCAAAHTFIGTPLSTFTAYITRMRGYLNRTLEIPLTDDPDNPEVFYLSKAGIYDRTYYFMKHHMYQLHTKPKVHFPLWIRDFVDVFQGIDDDELDWS